MSDRQSNGVDRRSFLRSSAVAATAGGLIFGDWKPAEAADLPKRRLGRTNLMVTTISFGAIQMSNASHQRVVDRVIDQGINLIHTAARYTGGQSIKIVGEVMKRKRSQVYLALKLDFDINQFDQMLRTLNTDYVDLVVPAITSPGRITDANYKQQLAALKRAGKVRWIAYAGHSAEAPVLQAAVGDRSWDACLLKYNLGNRRQLDPIIRQAVSGPRMGFMVMKAAADRGGMGMTDTWKELLKNKDLATLTLGMGSIQHVDENIRAGLQTAALPDEYSVTEPRPAASAAVDLDAVCPQQVAINEYLRAAMYRDRGDHQLARELVQSIPARRSLAVCNNCGACNNACGIKVLSAMQAVAAG